MRRSLFLARPAAAVLSLILALAACAPKPSPFVPIDPALVTLVPPDTVYLSGIRIKPLQGTALWKKFTAGQNLRAVEEFTRATGLDPRKDLWEFLIASNGKDTLVFVRGKLSPEMGLEPKLDIPNAKRMSHKGYQMIGDERNAVAFMNGSTAVAGPTAALRRVIDERDSGKGGIPPSLKPLVESIPRENQIWAAGDVAGRMPKLDFEKEGNWANLNNFAAALQRVTLGMDLTKGLNMRLEAQCRTEQDAKQINQTIRGLVGMGRLSTRDDQKDLLKFYDAFQSEAQGAKVLLRADLDESLVNEAFRLADSFGGRRPSTPRRTD